MDYMEKCMRAVSTQRNVFPFWSGSDSVCSLQPWLICECSLCRAGAEALGLTRI